MDSGASLGRFELYSRVSKSVCSSIQPLVLIGECCFPEVKEEVLTCANSHHHAHGSPEEVVSSPGWPNLDRGPGGDAFPSGVFY